LVSLCGAGPGSVRRVMTLPQKTTSSATAVAKSVAGNSNSVRCITETTINESQEKKQCLEELRTEVKH